MAKTPADQPAATTTTRKQPAPDFAAFVGTQGSLVLELTNMFQDFVTDTTNPQFQQIVTDLASDSVRIAQMRAKGAREALVREAADALKARAESVLHIPGLVATGRQAQFLVYAHRIIEGLIGYGFAVLRTSLNLPPLETDPPAP